MIRCILTKDLKLVSTEHYQIKQQSVLWQKVAYDRMHPNKIT